MKEIAQEIRSIIDGVLDRLTTMSVDDVSQKETPNSWTKKEIFGHLIDSAANNHQRFVRACYNDAASFPTYSQTDWVQIQQYDESEWSVLVELWAAYNRHLSHVIEQIPKESLNALVNIGRDEPVTLEFVIDDYLRHLRHHMDDITLEEI
jgi:hypothetical protein